MSQRLWWTHVLPPAAWATAIWVASSRPAPSAPPMLSFTHADKLVHGALWAVLAWLFARAVTWWFADDSARALALAWGLAVGWGALDEWHQSFVPQRSADGMDAVADALGAAFGIALWAVWQRGSRKRLSSLHASASVAPGSGEPRKAAEQRRTGGAA